MIALISAAVADPWEEASLRRAEAPPPWSGIEVARYGAVVAELASLAPDGAPSAPLLDRARALGLDVAVTEARIEVGGPPGAPWVTLRRGEAFEGIWTAPHPWDDRWTGEIAGALYDGTTWRAAVFATHPRATVDPTHAPDSAYQAAVRATADALPILVVAQLHGYAPESSEHDAIVGLRRSDRRVRAVRRALGGDVVAGADAPNLAGRQNALLPVLGERFVHLELSLATREDLRDDPEARARLATALAREERW